MLVCPGVTFSPLHLPGCCSHGELALANRALPVLAQVEGDSYQLKPMNCPFHIEIFKQGFYSYRDLPLRWAELGTVYRYERSGTMQGLFRVRGFTQVLPQPLLYSRAWGFEASG